MGHCGRFFGWRSLLLWPSHRFAVLTISQPEPRLVDLNVVAVDSHGQPVTDLSSDDFEITDGGKQQKIAFFHHSNRAQWQTSTLAHNELSNRSGATIPYATVILFDLMNEGFGTRGYAAKPNRSRAGEPGIGRLPVSVFLDQSWTVACLRFTVLLPSNHSSQHKGPGPARSSPFSTIRCVPCRKRRPVDVDVAGRVEITFRALEKLAQQLSRVPGRKNIVWVTDGVPIALGPERSDTGDLVDFRPEIRKLGERSIVPEWPSIRLVK